MDWAKVEFSRPMVNAAARAMIDGTTAPADLDQALNIVNNWRAAHAFPLNTFQMYLRTKAREVDRYPIVAQRIKRLPAIHLKLRLIPDLRLTQMQDIGGCRSVVRSIRGVDRLVRAYERSGIKHELIHKDDYLEEPRDSGYRGVHLVYRYYSDRSQDYNGLKVEMQVRTRLQHAWATAVETVGTFKRQALKSGLGDVQWLRFFALMGSVISIRERSPLVPGTPEDEHELIEELRYYVDTLGVIGALTGYTSLLDNVPRGVFKGIPYFLLELRPGDGRLVIHPFSRRESEVASQEYLASERQGNLFAPEERDAVLVSVDSMRALRSAYPNYFADTRRFVQEVTRAVRRGAGGEGVTP